MNAEAWEKLHEIAMAQEGYFSGRQALDAGFSPQLIAYHVNAGNFERAMRAVFRLHPYPAGEHEDLVVVSLWAGDEARFSHETALALRELTDALPAKVHLTVPAAWRRRRVTVPKLVRLHYRDPHPGEIDWVGPLRVTNIGVTIEDCMRDHVDPLIVRQAIDQARARGLISSKDAALFRRLHAGKQKGTE